MRTPMQEMEFHLNKVATLTTWKAKHNHLEICISLWENDPEVHKCYMYDENMHYMDDRFKKRDFLSEELAILATIDMERKSLPTFHIDCLHIDKENFGGLYFLGDIKYDPTYGKLFLVKIGSSSNVGKRMRTYTTHNPMFFHSHTALECTNFYTKEKIAQAFLSRVSIGVPYFSNEWFIVEEETYFKLCDLFKDKDFFEKVATGTI